MTKMGAIIVILTLGFLIISGFSSGISTSNIKNNEFGNKTINSSNHNVFIEEATATWCPNCPGAADTLYELHEEGNYSFDYVAMIHDENKNAKQRLSDDYNLWALPTCFIDGGFEMVIGDQAKSVFEEKITNASTRVTPDLIIDIETDWNESEKKLGLVVTVFNNETSSYTGNLKVYIAEIYSRWFDFDEKPYHYGFLDFAVDTSITINAKDDYQVITIWVACCAGFPDVDPVNLKVFAVMFNPDPVSKFSDPPYNERPYDAYFADQSASTRVEEGNFPPVVAITEPKKENIYLFGNPIQSALLGNTILIGKTNIVAKAFDDSNVEKVEFYINGDLVETDNEAPYEYLWNSKAFGKNTISAKTYDDEGKNFTANLDVFALILGIA